MKNNLQTGFLIHILRDLVTSAKLLHFLLALLPSWLLLSFSSSLPALDESRAADYNNSRKLTQIHISKDLNRDYKFVILRTLLFLRDRLKSVELLGFLWLLLPCWSSPSFFTAELLSILRTLLSRWSSLSFQSFLSALADFRLDDWNNSRKVSQLFIC